MKYKKRHFECLKINSKEKQGLDFGRTFCLQKTHKIKSNTKCDVEDKLDEIFRKVLPKKGKLIYSRDRKSFVFLNINVILIFYHMFFTKYSFQLIYNIKRKVPLQMTKLKASNTSSKLKTIALVLIWLRHIYNECFLNLVL